MGKKGKKQRLERISFYGHKPEKILKALMKVDPKRIKELEEEERYREASEIEER